MAGYPERGMVRGLMGVFHGRGKARRPVRRTRTSCRVFRVLRLVRKVPDGDRADAGLQLNSENQSN